MTHLNRLIPLLLLPLSVFAQSQIGTGAVQKLYEQHCTSCHGADLKGGLGRSLIEDDWQYVGKDRTFLDYVKEGYPELGMPPFGEVLDTAQIRSLEIYIQEIRQKTQRAGVTLVPEVAGVYEAGGYKFRVETVVDGLELPWSIAFLPTGDLLVTERGGQLRQVKGGQLQAPVEGMPEIWSHGQGGLLEVAPHPDYGSNGWIYLSYTASGGERDGNAQGATQVVRGRLKNNQWVEQEMIFEVPFEFHSSAGAHFGSRFVFKEGYLYFSIGDRGSMQMAQDLSLPNGKIHRIHDDGRIPKDNPFVDIDDAYPTIWTYGNRNPQGLDLHPVTGEIWESEHGPRGGDEINLVEGGNNYGWPVISYGMNYNGKPITDKTAAPGMEQPKHYWTPSIAVCGIDFYEGDLFPDWKYNLFVGGLASKELHRLVVEDGAVLQDEIILKDLGRVRDVASGPDGTLYIVFNGPDQIVRLVPAR